MFWYSILSTYSMNAYFMPLSRWCKYAWPVKLDMVPTDSQTGVPGFLILVPPLPLNNLGPLAGSLAL